MIPLHLFATALLGLGLSPLAWSATPVHKCIVNGTVTYQAEPCRTAAVRPRPTLDQLNADRKRQAEAAASAARNEPAAAVTRVPSPGAAVAASMPASGRAPGRADSAAPSRSPAAPSVAPAAAFKCDGRRFCSQMTSCAEAKFFLARCPDVRMDGDRDGIPCEEQWCGH